MWCDGNMGFFGWTTMVLLWGAVVGLIAWTIRFVRPSGSVPRPTPLDILERRFAAGEIDRDDFEERRGLLEEHPYRVQ